MAEEVKYFFVYHEWNGCVWSQKWAGEAFLAGEIMPILQKHEITEEEFRRPLSALVIMYPYKGLP